VATEVRMPKLGMSMKKGIVTRWLKNEGDPVGEGEDLLEIATDKVNAVVQAPASGVLGKIVMATKGFGAPGALLAFIGEPGEQFPDVAETVAATPQPAAVGTPRAATVSGNGAAASPAAKRRARELGIDIAAVPPAVAGKRITTDDVEAYAALREAGGVGLPGRVVPFEGVRGAVAEHMTLSLQQMAQVTITREVNASALVAYRAALAAGFEAATGVSLSYTDLLIQAVAGLLPNHPRVNSTTDDAGIHEHEEVHVGFAVALDEGLIVPVIRDADKASLGVVAQARVELAGKCRDGSIGLDEIEGGTFTVTNLGSFGADAFTPIVNPPQSAILGVGRIMERPAAVDGRVEVRPTMWLSLTFDHRSLDGAPAAKFLAELADALEGLG
jgi:pyruvate dehydrogenase E2 component (dihydrolipoyllysine-residue acetyltransferase)